MTVNIKDTWSIILLIFLQYIYASEFTQSNYQQELDIFKQRTEYELINPDVRQACINLNYHNSGSDKSTTLEVHKSKNEKYSSCCEKLEKIKDDIPPISMEQITYEVKTWGLNIDEAIKIAGPLNDNSKYDNNWDFVCFSTVLHQITNEYKTKIERLEILDKIIKFKNWKIWELFCDNKILFKFESYKALIAIISSNHPDEAFSYINDYVKWTYNNIYLKDKIKTDNQLQLDKQNGKNIILVDIGCPYSIVKTFIKFTLERFTHQSKDYKYKILHKLYHSFCINSLYNRFNDNNLNIETENQKIKEIDENQYKSTIIAKLLYSIDIEKLTVNELNILIKHGYFTIKQLLKTEEIIINNPINFNDLQLYIKKCDGDEICIAYVLKALRGLHRYAKLDNNTLYDIVTEISNKNCNIKNTFKFLSIVNTVGPKEDTDIYKNIILNLFNIYINSNGPNLHDERGVIDYIKSIISKISERKWKLEDFNKFLSGSKNLNAHAKHFVTCLNNNNNSEEIEELIKFLENITKESNNLVPLM